MNSIELPVSELKTILPGINKMISRKTTLPVLGCVRIERNADGQVTLQATDLEDHLTASLKDSIAGEAGAVLVPWEPLAKAIKGSANGDSIAVINEGEKGIKLRTFVGTSPIDQRLELISEKEWPPMPIVKDAGIAVDAELRTAIQQAMGWASQDATRLILNSAYLDVSDPKGHYVVSTDGRALFSANSFNFNLKESLLIPRRRFLEWSGAWENEPCWLAYEPGKAHPTTKIKGDGWLQFKTPRWTFITGQIDGRFPNWKQVVPRESTDGTEIQLSDAALKQMLQIIPKLPGDEAPNHPVRLRITGDQFLLEGQRQSEWTSIPIDDWKVTGQPATVAVNRHYLMAALRLELNHLHITDPLTPIVFTRGGKRVLVMPVNLEGPKRTSVTQPQTTETPKQTEPNQTEMSKTTSTTDTPAAESSVKTVIDQIEKIKDTLKAVLTDFNDLLATIRAAEKEKKATEKEIESIRATLRKLQKVQI